MNTTCSECIQRSLPFDPRKLTVDLLFKQRNPYSYPRYNRPDCESCPDRPEEPPIQKEVQPAPRELRDSFHKTQVLFNDLTNRLNKHIDASKKKRAYKYK